MRPLYEIARAESLEQHQRNAWRRVVVGVLALLAATFLLTRRVSAAEEDPQKALDRRLAAERDKASRLSQDQNARTAEQRKAAKQRDDQARDKMTQKQNLAEFKEKTLNNLASIKELFAKGETAWKAQHFADAGSYYTSVSMATVPGSEDMAETSRGRLIEMEEMAITHLKAADDLDLKRDFVKEVDELGMVNREFVLTKAHDKAERRLINLKSRPDVAAFVELSEAEALESKGKLTEAVNVYNSVATNPRYEHSVAALKARRKVEDLDKNENSHAKIKAELDAKAEKEAPVLISSARNFVSNNLPKLAAEKLQQVVDKFPGTKYADEAKKLLDELK